LERKGRRGEMLVTYRVPPSQKLTVWLMDGVYGDHVHQNPGQHLDVGTTHH
jgi:hypothetical protein